MKKQENEIEEELPYLFSDMPVEEVICTIGYVYQIMHVFPTLISQLHLTTFKNAEELRDFIKEVYDGDKRPMKWYIQYSQGFSQVYFSSEVGKLFFPNQDFEKGDYRTYTHDLDKFYAAAISWFLEKILFHVYENFLNADENGMIEVNVVGVNPRDTFDKFYIDELNELYEELGGRTIADQNSWEGAYHTYSSMFSPLAVYWPKLLESITKIAEGVKIPLIKDVDHFLTGRDSGRIKLDRVMRKRNIRITKIKKDGSAETVYSKQSAVALLLRACVHKDDSEELLEQLLLYPKRRNRRKYEVDLSVWGRSWESVILLIMYISRVPFIIATTPDWVLEDGDEEKKSDYQKFFECVNYLNRLATPPISDKVTYFDDLLRSIKGE